MIMSDKHYMQYAEDRSNAESFIDDMFISGEKAELSQEQILDDVADLIFNSRNIKVKFTIE